MPRKKISLEEAFQVFEDAGLEIEVRGVHREQHHTPLSAFLEDDVSTNQKQQQEDIPHKERNKMIRITLYAKHTVSSGGSIYTANGQQNVVNNETVSYGPGVVTVSEDIAQHLLRQDRAFQAAEERMVDGKFRSYAVVPMVTQHGVVNAGIQVSEDRSFDLSSFLGRLADNQIHIIR